MSRADEELMDEMHKMHAEMLLETLRKYRDKEILDANGHPLPPPPALLAQVGRFLKDNGIDRPANSQDSVDVLAGKMPEFDSFDDVPNISRIA